MTIPSMTNRERIATRACVRVFDNLTDGWERDEACDRHYDAGEWSGPAWAQNWEQAAAQACQLVSERFEMDAEHLRTLWEYQAPHDHFVHLMDAHADAASLHHP